MNQVFKKQRRPGAIRKLEQQVAKAIAKLNVLIHENKEACDKIDQVRRERLQMNQVFKKQSEDIKDNIHFIKDIQVETDAAKEQNEEAMRRMGAMKKRLEF